MTQRFRHGQWTRRSVLKGIAATVGLAAAPLLAACGGAAPDPTAAPAATSDKGEPAASKPVASAVQELSLVFSGWILDQNPVIRDLVQEYGDDNGVTITVASAPEDLQQKLLLEAQQGKSTWGGWEGHTAFLNTAPLAEANVIAVWDKYVTAADRDDFLPTSWAEQQYNGQVYSIPFRVSPLVMIYRPSLLEQLGVSEFPTTWEDLFRLCETAVNDLSEPGKRMNGIVFVTTAWYGLWTVMATLVPKPFDVEAGLAKLDLPEAVEALTIMKRLYSYSSPDILPAAAPIENITQAGLSTVHFQHLLMKRRMNEALQGDLRLARLPKTAAAEGTTYWSSGPNILKNYGADGEVAKFWLWLSQQKRLYDTMWLKNGSPPNRRSLWAQYEPLKGNELEAELWDVDAMQEKSQGIPNSLWIPMQATHTKRVTDDFLLEKIASPEEALAEIQRATEDDIAKQKK